MANKNNYHKILLIFAAKRIIKFVKTFVKHLNWAMITNG